MAINNPTPGTELSLQQVVAEEVANQLKNMNLAPAIQNAETKVNPYMLVGFMMILTIIIMAAAVFKYIGPEWFALAVGVWINVPGVPTKS